MAKPRLIIVVRHAQSEGNKNREIHQTIPDHRVKLTALGWQQAHEAGRKLRSMLRDNDTLHFFTSPYRRTRETTEGILSTLTTDDADGPSPFKREKIKVYEEPRLREQDFGNFQPCGAEMERMWQERADYGHFFYRIPNGESAADAYDRVSGFNESLWRQFGEDDFASVCVLVTHGLMSRVFLMKWYHFTVEYFEDLRNINHCEFLIMRKHEESGKYILENKLRTWSELRRKQQEKEEEQQLLHKHQLPHIQHQHQQNREMGGLTRTKTFIPLRRWGGCPNGCNHGRASIKRRDDLEMLRMKDTKESVNGVAGEKTIVERRGAGIKRGEYNSDDEQLLSPDAAMNIPPQIDVSKTLDSDVSSPDGTPSFISAEDRHIRALKSPHYVHLHVGRDGGGTYSGHASVAGSEDELSSDEDRHHHHHDMEIHSHHHAHAHKLRSNGHGHVKVNSSDSSMSVENPGASTAGDEAEVQEYLDASGMRRGAKANRLGDHSHNNSDSGSDRSQSPEVEKDAGDVSNMTVEEIKEVEKNERSIMGSVY